MGGANVAGSCFCFPFNSQSLLTRSSSPHPLSSTIFSSLSTSPSSSSANNINKKGALAQHLAAATLSDRRPPFPGAASASLSRRVSLNGVQRRARRCNEITLTRASRASAHESGYDYGDAEEEMKARSRHESLTGPETAQHLAAPVAAELMEPEDRSSYVQTELMYRKAVSQDPDNVMLLSNFAQFIFLVHHDHDRAEHYFERAAGAEPADAEALNRYANFLWVAREELAAAEEAYLEAIAADPGNSYYAASYAHFLWSTGGEDTCYPLDGCVAG